MGIRCFLSNESLSRHYAYLESLRARKRMEMGHVRSVETQIRAHELYFSSFRRERMRCERVRRGFGSENAFTYALKEYADGRAADFLYIFPIRRYPYVGYSTDERDAYRAVLSIDLCEHAYFLDYGFERDSYLHAALSHLDLSVLDKDSTL